MLSTKTLPVLIHRKIQVDKASRTLPISAIPNVVELGIPSDLVLKTYRLHHIWPQ